MKTMKISELKTHLSSALKAVREGERIVVLDRDIPVAEVSPIAGSGERLEIRAPRKPFSAPRLGRIVEGDPMKALLEDRNGR